MSTALKAFAAAIIAIVTALPAYADPPGRVGRLSLISGSVSLAPAGLEDEWAEAYINRPITIGDRLWTAERSRAEIRIGSAAVRLDATTSADVLNVDDRVVQLRLGEGRMQLRVRALPPDGFFEIDTPGAAVVIREPGAYRIDVRPDADVTTLVVRRGSADIYGNRVSLDVREGESIVFENGGESYDFRSVAQQDDFDRFYAARDARDEQRPARYVPVEMTGYEELDEYGSWREVQEYGNVWFPSRVDAGWVPYRDGRWVWVEPWGWTWVDNAPWGFAPFHYGRWVRVRDRWGWYPGEIHARPVYAPALVAWVGGPGFGVSVSSGAPSVVGWFPLAYREPYIPWYETSPTYVREVNVAARVTSINVTNINVTQINYQYRRDPVAVTAVPASVVAQAQPVTRATVQVPPQRLAQASVVAGAAPVPPARQSVIVRQASGRPPPSVERRAVVAVQPPPPAPALFAERERALAQKGDQPFKVQPLPPRTSAAALAPDAPSPTRPAAPGTTAPAPRAPAAAATAVATVAPVQVIKPPPAQARAAGAPPPSARAASRGTPETPGARDDDGAGRQPPERAGASPAATPGTGGAPAAAVAPPRTSETPAPAPEAGKRAADAPKQVPTAPSRAGTAGSSAERQGPPREVEPERSRPTTVPTPAPRELSPPARPGPESAPPARPGPESTPPTRAVTESTPQTRRPPEVPTPPRAVPGPLPERVTPGPERAVPRDSSPPTPRATPPSPERIVPQERPAPAPQERAAPPAPRVAPSPPAVERAAPREAPPMPRAALSPERSAQPMPERPAPAPQERAAPAAPRAAPAAPPPERAAPREAPAPSRATPPERGGEGAGRAPAKEQHDRGRDEKARDDQRS